MYSGGLDEALYSIIQECQQQGVPFIFALSRKALGKACAKQVPVSIVGIFNYEGAEVSIDAFVHPFVRRSRYCMPRNSVFIYAVALQVQENGRR